MTVAAKKHFLSIYFLFTGFGLPYKNDLPRIRDYKEKHSKGFKPCISA